jgi:hypothetical protein
VNRVNRVESKLIPQINHRKGIHKGIKTGYAGQPVEIVLPGAGRAEKVPDTFYFLDTFYFRWKIL